jgi:activator of 2-hydroxyglutaryl-CoA dehydratase
MCTVFAESEVVSLIAQNKEIPDIIHGLNKSVATKTLSLANRVGKKEAYMMTGGVAKNIGVVKCLEEKLGSKIFIPQEPQIVGAVGAALIALESI